MNNCLVCRARDSYPLCEKCSRKAFLVEKARQILASIRDLDSLRNTYNSKYAEIKNLNTSSFWDKKMSGKVKLNSQDGMTRDRVKLSFGFLPRSVKKVLDIGAGNGFIEEFLSQINVKIFGNDISSVSVKNLKSKFKGEFRKESLYRMQYPKNSFDAIFALEVLEHVPPTKIFNLLKKIKGILRKNGSFILSIPTNEGLENMKNNPSGHVRVYTENLIRAELEIVGFKIIKIKTLYAFKNFYAFKKISSNFLRNRWEPNDIVILAKPQ